MKDQRLTDGERDLLRALAFDEYAYWERTAAASQIAHHAAMLAAYGERAWHTPSVRMYANTDTWCRSIDKRGSDARVTLRTPIRGDWARRKHVASSIKSRGRFLAWYVPAMNARRLADHRHALATDVNLASLYAGLVDVDAVTHPTLGIGVNVTPRDVVPTWEPRDVTPFKCPSVRPYLGTPIAPYGRLEPHEYEHGSKDYTRQTRLVEVNGEQVEQLVGITCPNYEPRSMVPMAAYLASCADTMAYSPSAMDLVDMADKFLGEHGARMSLPDSWDKLRFRWRVSPDRAAYRGKVRFQHGSPVRVQHGAKVIAATADTPRHMVPALDRVAIGKDGQYELETRQIWATYCTCGPIRDTPMTWRGKLITRSFQRDKDECVCTPRGWIGHRFVRFPRTVRNDRVVIAKARVAVQAAPKGPIATPWNMSERSLATAAKRVNGAWQIIESAIRVADDGTDIAFSDGAVVTVIGASQVFDHHRGRAYPVREYARRTSLAAVTLA